MSVQTPNHDDNHRSAVREGPITFRGSLTVPDAYAAFSLAQPFGNKIATWIVRAFLVAALTYMSWLSAYAYYSGEFNLARMAFAGVVLFLFLICGAIGREIWYRKRAAKLCKEGRFLYTPTEGEIDGNSIRSKAETGAGELKWSAFCGYREANTVAVLYQQYPNFFVILARSKFENDHDWNAFLQIARQNLKPK